MRIHWTTDYTLISSAYLYGKSKIEWFLIFIPSFDIKIISNIIQIERFSILNIKSKSTKIILCVYAVVYPEIKVVLLCNGVLWGCITYMKFLLPAHKWMFFIFLFPHNLLSNKSAFAHILKIKCTHSTMHIYVWCTYNVL